MIDSTILPVYLTAVIALLLVPGPDMLLIASSSLSYGRKVGIFASLGNATSGLLLTLLAALGVSTMVAMNPMALTVLQLCGGAYLLKMGVDCLRVTEHAVVTPITREPTLAKVFYQRALLSNLLNPKALVFFVLFLPQFVSNNIAASSGEQMLALGILLNICGLLFNFSLVALVSFCGSKLLESENFRCYQHKLMGAIFLVLAIWMLSGVLMPFLAR